LGSAPGAGSTFTVYLPLAADATVARTPGAAGAAGARATETILVVADEPAIRGLVGEILRRDNYSVIEAEHGEAALQTLEDTFHPIAAVVVDLSLPGSTGLELGIRLRKVRPDLPMLCVSGQGGKGAEHVRAGLGFEVGYIQKPFTPTDLRRKVREVLGGPAARAA